MGFDKWTDIEKLSGLGQLAPKGSSERTPVLYSLKLYRQTIRPLCGQALISGLVQVEGVVARADHQPFSWEEARLFTLTIEDGRKIDLTFEDAKGTIATACSDLYCDPDEPDASRAA